ncbi:VanZ family protein [Alkalihalobacillus deserti]|nr:VanZ family protein [Alkalihalobacillus deserti]
MQYVTQLGVFDVDDIILNSLGGLIGILVFSYLKREKGY